MAARCCSMTIPEARSSSTSSTFTLPSNSSRGSPLPPISERIPWTLAPRDDAWCLPFTESCYVARPCKPYTGGAALLAMTQGGAQPPQAEGLSEDVGVDRDIHHQRMAGALLQHLVELVDDHVAELFRPLLAVHHMLGIVQFNRIRHRQDRPGPGTQPHGLVVHRPVHQVFV